MTENNNPKSISERTVKPILEWLESIAVAVITVVLLFTFVFRVVGIVGPSMQNTLYEGDKIIISGLFYTPRCGDVVVISRNYTNEFSDETASEEPIIKRIIATEGMTVDIDFEKGIVYVDGKALEEEYTKGLTTAKYDVAFPILVEEGKVFVLGDNRNNSMDSRDSRIGLIDERYILGKALFRVYRSGDYRTSFFDMFGVVE